MGAESFDNAAGRVIVQALIRTIGENRAYLSEIDGKIGFLTARNRIRM